MSHSRKWAAALWSGLALVGVMNLASAQEATSPPPAPVRDTDSPAELRARLERVEKQLAELLKEKQDARAAAARLGNPVSAESGDGGAFSQNQVTAIVEKYLQSKEEQKKATDAAGALQAGDVLGGEKVKSLWPTAGWENGFFIQSPDKAFQLRLTGQIQADYRGYLQEGDRTDIDSFLIRRARLGIEANLLNYYEFRLLPDFGQGKAVLQDAYINIHYLDAFQVQAGKFKEPVSYEQLIQDRFVPTLERSLIDQIVPARDVGVMVHGHKLLGDKFDWAVGVFNGEINGDTDTNNRKDLAARVAIRPFNWEGLPTALHLLQFGISGSTGIEQEPINPNTLKTPLGVPWFQFNSGVAANGLRNRWTPEVSYFYGPFGMAAQFLRMDQEIAVALGKPSQDVSMEGYYILTTLLLTGEERTTYSQAVAPLRPFNPCAPCANPGAWELLARFGRLDVGAEVFAPGKNQLADPTKYASAASELTLGFNWYLNAWVRMQVNYERAWFEDPVLLGPGPQGRLKDSNTLGVRLQVIF